MRLRLLALAVVFVATGHCAATASAHPLGNFTISHLTEVRVSDDRVQLRYILDKAEIPTFQARKLSSAEVLEQAREEVASGLQVTADGRRLRLRPDGAARVAFPPGEGGLRTTRIELPLQAPVRGVEVVDVRDRTFDGRQGYTAIVPRPGDGTAVRASTPAQDPTGGLRRYPESSISRPVVQRSSTLRVRDGSGTLESPRYEGGTETTGDKGGDGFAGVFEDAAAGQTTLLFLLLAALGWGALHALSPGHGKAMVAAYLVGTRGTSRHAVALGGVVTITHTMGVFALGVVTLVAAQYILPEDLFPWLTLASGLLVVGIGGAVLRSRWRVHRAARAHAHRPHAHDDHHHHHAHDDHGHHHDHDDHGLHDHGHHHHHGHGDGHGHSHDLPETITWKGLIGMGAAAGLIPCPSALVVLLGAVAQHQVALGLLLITAFSVGLAATLTILGLMVVHARRLTARVNVPPGLVTAMPAASALVIVALGCALTLQAAPDLV